jgi:multidrug efflux pump
MGQAHASRAVLVTERAIGTDQEKKFVLVVGADNKAEYREVTLGASTMGLRVGASGLKPGERIVVNGLQRVRPGAVVQPQQVTMEAQGMNISRFFIDRPIFAGVLSLLVFLAGLIALRGLPISEYPEVVPPSVVVRAQYPGANPKVIAETVATPLEESINGVEGMLYMGSQATTDGVMTLTVTFQLGTDPDKAQQLVQNRVSQAEPRLPEEVRRLGITTVKSAPDLTMVVHLVSPNDRYDINYLRNYAVLNVKDRLARIPGVGQVQIFGGGEYSMRVWLDPQKVAQRGLSGRATWSPRSASRTCRPLPASSAPRRACRAWTASCRSMPGTAAERGGVRRHHRQGRRRWRGHALRDIARLELGAADYSLRSLVEQRRRGGIGVFQAPGSNALQISDQVRRPWTRSRRPCPRAWSTASPTTRRSSCAPRSNRWCTRCWRRSCWWCWW